MKIFPLVLFTILLFLFSLPIYAAIQGDVVITEIMYNLEGTDDPHEWIEILNTRGQSIDLTDWRFNDGKNHVLNIPPQKGGQGSIVIQSNEYIIFADDAATFLADHPGFSKTIIDTAISLKNTSATLSLIDADGNIIDSITYQNTWGADGNEKSLEKINASGNNDNNNWQESSLYGGTPGAQNSTPESIQPPPPNPTPPPPPPPDEPPDPDTESNATTTNDAGEQNLGQDNLPISQKITYPGNIFINEIMPYPIGSDDEGEWIEIFNENDEQADISAWQMQDKQGSTKIFTFSDGTIISGKSYLVLSRPTTKITLNNDGDGIELLQPDGKIAQTVEFGKATRGKSYARDGEIWKWSDVPTPGSANIISLITTSPQQTKANDKKSAARGTDAELNAEQTQKDSVSVQHEGSDSVQRPDNIASVGSSIELGANPKSNNLILYIIAPLLALLSAIFIFLLKKRLTNFL